MKSRMLFSFNMELNDFMITVCLRKSNVSVERNLVCNVIEKSMEHGIHSRPCSYTNNVIDQLPWQL